MKRRRRPYIDVTAPMDERMALTCIRTWQCVGGDVMACLGKDEVEREVVFDVVCDYIDNGIDEEAVKEFKALSYDGKMDLLRRTFPYEMYS